jgi:hypothetical protein
MRNAELFSFDVAGAFAAGMLPMRPNRTILVLCVARALARSRRPPGRVADRACLGENLDSRPLNVNNLAGLYCVTTG